MSSDFINFENRKKDHIRLALDKSTQGLVINDFSKIKLIHHALPEIKFSELSLKTKLLSVEFSSPHFVSAMTAGHENSYQINLNLAKAAAKNNWLMAVGSQRRELIDIAASAEWVKIKSEVSQLKLVANIGILELNSYPASSILKLIENTEAIGIYIHLNPLQEIFQNNTDIDFTHSLKNIENLVRQSPVPVLIKEVGFGINKTLARSLFSIGVKVVDVAGHGGTHWGQIEALRQPADSAIGQAASAFTDWGQSSVECLLELQDQNLFHQVWASGGVRSGVDSAKCMALGARAVGIAQPLMQAAVVSTEAVDQKMQQFDFELKTSMFCTNIKKCEEFIHKKVWYGANN